MRRLRANLRKLIAVCMLGFAVGIVLSTASDQVYAAFGGVLAAVALATFSGGVYAYQAAASYAADRTTIRKKLESVWAYASRAGAWGVAGAGLGVLLSEAIPTPLRNVEGPALPTSALLGITFAGVGVGMAILETWRDSVRQGGDASAGGLEA